MLETLTYEVVHPLIGTSAWIHPEPEHRVELRIVSVARVMESEAVRLKRHPFSIYFVGPGDYKVPQGSYLTRHDAFPEPFWLFLVPISETAEAMVYEAVFT